MKKMLALMIAGVMVFSMTACGQSGKEEKPAQTEETVTEETATEETEAGEAVTEETATVEEEEAPEDIPLAGGWSKTDSPEITEEIKALLEKATADMVGAAYTPVAYIGSQVVAGRNHAVLCTITPVVPDAVAKYAVVILYEDLEGNVTITSVLDSEAEAEVLPDAGTLMGGWSAPETPAVTEEAAAALAKAAESKLGAEYTPIALLATQIVSGTNYSLLCEIKAVTPEAEAGYAVVHVYQDLEGNAEITDIFEFA